MTTDFNQTSIFYKENDELLQNRRKLKNFIINESIFKNDYLQKSGKLTIHNDNAESISCYVKLYLDRIECYNDKFMTDLEFFISSRNCTIVFGDNPGLIEQNFNFYGFVISNAKTSQLFYCENEVDLNQWKFFLKRTFLQNMQIFSSLYNVECKIGKGATAQIYLAQEIESNCKVAIKIIQKEHLTKHSQIQQIINEVGCLKLAHIKNMYNYFGIIEGGTNIYIIMQYISDMSLFNYLKYNKMNPQEGFSLFKKLFYKIKVFYDHKVLHGDIKIENIMLKQNKGELEPYLIDFGFAQLNFQNEKNLNHFSLVGTAGYAAPEMLADYQMNGHFIFKQKYDVYSMGIVLYCLLYSKFPFSASNFNELLTQNKKNKINFPNNKNISKDTLELLKLMLKTNPQQRASIAVIDMIINKQTKQKNNSFKIRNYSSQRIENPKQIESTIFRSSSCRKLQISPQQQSNIANINNTTLKLLSYNPQQIQSARVPLINSKFTKANKIPIKSPIKISSHITFTPKDKILNCYTIKTSIIQKKLKFSNIKY